jgi:TPR repeat protein
MTNSNEPTDVTLSENEEMDFASGIAAFEAKHFSQAMQLLSPLSEKDAQSQHMLAIMFQNGLGTVENPMQAVKMMKASAEQGYPIAQHGLGFMYMQGECLEKNSIKAVEWFEKAAEQGMQGSLTTLAMMYEQGEGVEKDVEKAKELYKAAGFDDLG